MEVAGNIPRPWLTWDLKGAEPKLAVLGLPTEDTVLTEGWVCWVGGWVGMPQFTQHCLGKSTHPPGRHEHSGAREVVSHPTPGA